jgi:hypothetical protein
MTRLRRYSTTLSLIIVATILFLGNFAINVLALDVGDFIKHYLWVKSLLWVLLLFCLIATVFLFVREHNAPAARSESTVDTVFPTDADQVNRRVMLRIIRRYWIEGVLHKSLWNEVKMILNLKGRPDAVVHHCGLALLRAGQTNTSIPPGTSILKVYRQEQDGLLLLGEPGSGKTTLMLEAAEALLAEAESTSTLPIPVILNLSTWHTNYTRLDEWLVEQLNRDMGF